MPGSPVLVGRGGGSLVTDSRDPTEFPTTPPASTQTHFKSIPKIAGSEGGFIGLVVGLGVIFIGCCIGIFFLLRHRRHGGRVTRSKSGKLGVEDPLGRRGTLFGWRSDNPKRAGWVRAHGGEEGDEWDARDEFDGVQRLPYAQHGRSRGDRDAVPMESVHDLNGKTYDSLDAPAPSPGASAVNLVAPSAHDPWPRSRSPAEEESLSHSVYDHEHDPSDGRDSRDAKHMSVDSTMSFPGGTKFREAL